MAPAAADAIVLPSVDTSEPIERSLRRSNSDIPVSGIQSIVRPDSLATSSSMVEGLSHVVDLQGKEGEGVGNDQDDELLVIRLKGKKGKKTKKRKKKGGSKSQGNTPTCASGMPLGMMPEEDNVSLELDEDRRSKSSSFSSQMSMSDRSSVVEMSGAVISKSEGEHGSSPSLADTDRVANVDQSADGIHNQANSASANSSRTAEVVTGNGSAPTQDKLDDALSDGKLSNSENVEELEAVPHYTGQPRGQKSDQFNHFVDGTEIAADLAATKSNQESSIVEPHNVQSTPPTSLSLVNEPEKRDKIAPSLLPRTCSLDYDTTIGYNLHSVDRLIDVDDEAKSLSNSVPVDRLVDDDDKLSSNSVPYPQVQFETSLDDSMLWNLSMDDPGYTNLLLNNAVPTTTSTPKVAEQSSAEQSASSDHGSSSGLGSMMMGQSSSSTPSAEALSSSCESRKIDSSPSKGSSETSSPLGERVSPDGRESIRDVVTMETKAADSRASLQAAAVQVITVESKLFICDPLHPRSGVGKDHLHNINES